MMLPLNPGHSNTGLIEWFLEKMAGNVQTEEILSFAVTTDTLEQCSRKIESWIVSGEHARWLACLNPHSCVLARDNIKFASALRGASMLVPDGVGIVLASKILGGNIAERITGNDVFHGVNKWLNGSDGKSVFFLGSSEENLSEIVLRMKHDYPRIQVAGTYSPPFKNTFTEDENRLMIEAINASRPDVLWVGMTAPKQEIWLFENLPLLHVKFAAAIGAVFDFYSGRIKRSHPVFQRLGLEWLPRLIQEPRRLWRRNLVSSPRFVWRIIMERRQNG